jgi:hypothetical protein
MVQVIILGLLTQLDDLDFREEDGHRRYIIYYGVKGEHSPTKGEDWSGHPIVSTLTCIDLWHISERLAVRLHKVAPLKKNRNV